MNHDGTMRPPDPSDAASGGPVTLLNAPVLTCDGRYAMRTVTVETASALVRMRGFDSAIGHAETARAISALLGIDCPMRRVEFRQKRGEHALVFRLARRLPEGQVLASRRQLESIGYSFALLSREE